MNILFLSAWYPYPANNGSKLRIYNLLRGLSRQHRVTLITASDQALERQTAPLELTSLCERIEVVPWQLCPPRGMRRFLSFVQPRPAWVIAEPSPRMAHAIAREVRAGRHEAVIASELHMAVYSPEFSRLPAILEDVELAAYHSQPSQPRPRRLRAQIFWWKLAKSVKLLLPHFRACTVVSEAERELLKTINPKFQPVEVIPNCIDYEAYASLQADPQPNTLVFSGSLAFSANYEAICAFLREVYPLVKQAVPSVQLCITGKHTGRPLPTSDSSVTLTGYLEDVRPVIANSWVSVAPLLTGGGTRLKILEAMALGTPVVATTKGAEGLAVEAGRHLLIADRPEDFATAVVRLCSEADLRQRLVAEARTLVAERYNWAVVMPKVLDLLRSIQPGG